MPNLSVSVCLSVLVPFDMLPFTVLPPFSNATHLLTYTVLLIHNDDYPSSF